MPVSLTVRLRLVQALLHELIKGVGYGVFILSSALFVFPNSLSNAVTSHCRYLRSRLNFAPLYSDFA